MSAWTVEEENILREHYPTLGSAVHKLLKGRSSNACMKKASTLGIHVTESHTGKSGIRYWTAEEQQILIDNYKTMGQRVADIIPGRTESACCQQALKLGITANSASSWTQEETTKLIESNAAMPRSELAASLGKSVQAIRGKVRRLAISVQPKPLWSEEEDNIIKTYFPKEGWHCAKRITARTRDAVACRAKRLGVHGPHKVAVPRRYMPGTFSVTVNGTVCTSREEVAKALDITTGVLRRYLKQRVHYGGCDCAF